MVGVLAAVGDPVAVGVGATRVGPGQEFERRAQAIAIGILATIPDAVAVGVGAARVRPDQVFLPIGQPIAIGVLATIGDAVAVGIGAVRVRQRPGPLPRVREAVMVGVGGRSGGRRCQEDGGHQDGDGRHPGAPTSMLVHGRIVRTDCLLGNASVVPDRATPWSGSGGQRRRHPNAGSVGERLWSAITELASLAGGVVRR
ncbi:MAG: hypothetical protein QOI37_1446 [Chloroflexota bacterium]|nr:hypothetical protein [Chloroflexota bacterium]